MTHTPESFRTAADFLASIGGYSRSAGRLRIEADKLERKADEDKRIDELARISFNAELEYAREENPSRSQLLGWSESTEFQRNIARAGIRAVLAKLDEEKAAAPRQWNNWKLIPFDVTVEDDEGHIWRHIDNEWQHSFRDDFISEGGDWGGVIITNKLSPFTEIVGGVL